MRFLAKPMEEPAAQQICTWKYPYPYQIYSMDEECLGQLLAGSYLAVCDDDGALLGYLCFDEEAQVPAGKSQGVYPEEDVIDLGLGLRPDLCGLGLGESYLEKALDYVVRNYHVKAVRLTVASFNTRAIKVYRRVGFTRQDIFIRDSKEGQVEFITMRKKLVSKPGK